MLRGLYTRLKVRLNYWLDRTVDICDMILLDAYRLPWSSLQTAARKIARPVGDLAVFLRAFPRIPACRFVGEDYTIIFIGDPGERAEICHTYFMGSAVIEELDRVAVWTINQQTAHWLDNGADLVIFERSRFFPWTLRAPITFHTPSWMNMLLPIPDPIEQLLEGNQHKRTRKRINRGSAAGFAYRFSQEKADFDCFHYEMYLPFLRARHGESVTLSTYEHQWERWFKRGGLLLVTQDNQPVAGTLCYIANEVCYAVEGGIFHADYERLMELEVNAMSDWYTLRWAQEQGAKWLNFGGTRPYLSDGIFLYKRRWGAKAVQRRKLYPLNTFIARTLSPALRDHLNELGLIAEHLGGMHQVVIHDQANSESEADIRQIASNAAHQKLDGVLLFSNTGLSVYKAD